MRLPITGDLLFNKRSIPPEEPAPVPEWIFHQPHFIADDGAIGQVLLHRHVRGFRVGLAGHIPCPRDETDFDGSGGRLAEMDEFVLIPADDGLARDDGLRIRMHRIVKTINLPATSRPDIVSATASAASESGMSGMSGFSVTSAGVTVQAQR